MRFSFLLVLVAFTAGCGSSSNATDDGPDGTPPGTGAPGSDGDGDRGGDGGTDGATTDGGGDASKPDTCPVPQGDFAIDLPPGPAPNTGRRHAIVQVPSTGSPRVYISQLYQNGSFHAATLQRLTRNAPKTWLAQPIADGGIGLSVARSLAVTHGADPCVAYTHDDDGQLRLQCTSLSDRVIAPAASGGLAMGEHGAAKQVVYENGSADALHWVEVNPTAGTPELIEGPVWSLDGATAMQVDAQGRPHVVYATLEPNSPFTRTVRYATRGPSGWTTETVDTDSWSGSTEPGVPFALVLVAGQPVLAYHHRATRSLKLARRGATSWTAKTLSAPPMGYPNDSVGRSVAMVADCNDRLHLVFHRDFTTDPTPNLRLYRATLANDMLSASVALPNNGAPYSISNRVHGLSFHVAADGHQTVAADLGDLAGGNVYFAQR